MSESLREISVAIADDVFPELDLALRRGRHIDRSDHAQYTLLVEFQAELEHFYRRYGWQLVQRKDGYFFLLPNSPRLGRRHLSAGEMLVGQALALLYLDPASLDQGAAISREQVLAQLASTLGNEALLRAFNPKRRRHDERVAEETVRAKVGEALRRLSSLGFLDVIEDERLRLRPALLRFAEPARGTLPPEEALARLAEAGEIVLEPESESAFEEDAETEDEDEDAETEGDREAEEFP